MSVATDADIDVESLRSEFDGEFEGDHDGSPMVSSSTCACYDEPCPYTG